MGRITDAKDANESYGSIEYNGRTYVTYGTIGKALYKKDIDKCIGYIICDENSSSYTDLSDTSRRIYTLAADTEENFLLDHIVGNVLMEQPTFWRAIDTKEKDIVIPKYISSLGYLYWENN